MRKKIRALEKVLQVFGVPNPQNRAFELVTDVPALLGTGLPKLFLGIRVLRALHVRPEEVDKNTVLDILMMNASDAAIALPDIVLRGLMGKEAVRELQKAVAEMKKTERPEDARRTELCATISELMPDPDTTPAVSERSTDELIKILRRALALEVSRAKKSVVNTPETPSS